MKSVLNPSLSFYVEQPSAQLCSNIKLNNQERSSISYENENMPKFKREGALANLREQILRAVNAHSIQK